MAVATSRRRLAQYAAFEVFDEQVKAGEQKLTTAVVDAASFAAPQRNNPPAFAR